MIYRQGRYFLYRDEELSTWVMVKHYMGDATAFFMLPDQGKMQRLEETLNQNYFEKIMRLIDIRTANVSFPKLTMSTTYDLKTILSTLGITQIFSNEADLSGVTQDAPLKLSKAQSAVSGTIPYAQGPELYKSGEIKLITSNRTMLPSFFHNFLLLAGLCCMLPGSQTKGYQITGDPGYDKIQEGPQCQNFAFTITNISLSLLQKAIHWPGQTNIVFSPVSIAAAFTMLSLGAKGSTHKQIFNGLRFSLLKMPEIEVHRCFQLLLTKFLQPNYQIQMITGSSLFIDKHLKVADKFAKAVTELYHSETIPTNFQDIQQAKTQINKHTLKRSYGFVSQVVKDLPTDTTLALVNFFSFEGIRNDHNNGQIVKVEFYLDTGEVIFLPMLNRLDKFYLRKDSHLSSWVLMQHYVENSLAFFILPDPGKMQQLLENLSPEYLHSIQRDISQRVVNLNFPKFTISATYDLETVMRMLGITQIFSSDADLSKVTKDAPVKVSKAVHKAVLAIEDKEIKDIKFSKVFDYVPKVPTVKFNRPFLVIIKIRPSFGGGQSRDDDIVFLPWTALAIKPVLAASQNPDHIS
ncbi:hypothetical protein STEG23_019771 [Scotinomys teguina]